MKTIRAKLTKISLKLTGMVAVLTIVGTLSARAEAPVINNFSPTSGAVGDTVVINGANFIPPLSITFARNAGASGSFTSTKITVTVPSGAITGPIAVATSGGTVDTSTSFVVTSMSSGNPTIVMHQPVLANNQLSLNFTVTDLTNATFHLLQTQKLNNGTWTTSTGATLTTITPNNAYKFTLVPGSTSQFYRVQSP